MGQRKGLLQKSEGCCMLNSNVAELRFEKDFENWLMSSVRKFKYRGHVQLLLQHLCSYLTHNPFEKDHIYTKGKVIEKTN